MKSLDLNHLGNLAITGANGFVGRSIVEYIGNLPMENLPNRITLITRQGLNFDLPTSLVGLTVSIEQDLTKPWNLSGDISHLLNLAADGSNDPYSDLAAVQFATISRNLVEWIKSAGNFKRVFHASSGACFGVRPVDISNPPEDKKGKFVKSRIETENYLIQNSNKIGYELSIGRLFSFSGRRLLSKPQYAISSFISDAIRLKRIQVTGDPQTQRSYLHQDCMSNWILSSIISEEIHQDLQIGSSEAITIQQLSEYVAENTNADVDYSERPKAGDIYIPDNRETLIKLGVTEGMRWKEAVLEMITEARNANHGR
jgi:nucleoside-diphosphate-sugar epimerase